MTEGTAIIKAVISGDTLILQGRPTTGPPPERQLSLSSLQAPKVARGPTAAEEPWGWASREYLRRLAVGHQVTFKIDYTVPTLNNREFGTVTLNGESLNRLVVKEGWARVRTPRQGNEGEASPELEELQRLEAVAVAEKKGMHGAGENNPEGMTRENVQWGPEVNSQAVLEKIKGKPTKMIIEYVRDGASFRAILADSHTYINLSLAGVAAPRVNMAKASSAATGGIVPQPEPHALESRYFTETRLLQRDVDVVVGGIDKYGTFYGTILHPKGNISVELLKSGLARIVDYSIDYTTRDNALQYRLAERQAKAAQLKVWKNYVPPTITGSKEFTATVIEIVSGDMLVVKVDGGAEEERKLSLSSLRAPRSGNVKRGDSGEPWAAESKEFLRNKLIGRNVTVVIDYEREIALGEKKEKRAYASLYLGKGNKKKSVSEAILHEGLATLMRSRSVGGEEERAENYDDLTVAEAAGKAGKKGIHSGGAAPPPPRVTDLSLDAKKARSYLPHLQRETEIRAVVEYVFSGSRFKMFIPSENCSVMMALTSLRTPNPPRAAAGGGEGGKGRSGEPFGEEAKVYTRQQLLQRTVEVSLVDMDKNGVALGNITVLGGSGERTPFGLELVKRGLARVDERGTTSLPVAYVHALQEAQLKAQGGKVGLWSVVEEGNGAEAEEEITAGMSEELLEVKVSEIVDGVHFFYHQTGGGSGNNKNNAQGLTQIEEKMKALTAAEGTQGGKMAFEPRKGNIIAAIFDDGTGPLWYRARVEEKLGNNGGYKVLFIDYGNKAVVKASEIRTLDGSYTAIPPQAKEAVLAFLRAPGVGEDFGVEAGEAFARLSWGKELRARVYGKEAGALMVSLQDVSENGGGGKRTLNQAMVEEGLARVSKRADKVVNRLGVPAAAALVGEMKEAQEGARRGRLGMWRYGDVADSDDEGYGF